MIVLSIIRGGLLAAWYPRAGSPPLLSPPSLAMWRDRSGGRKACSLYLSVRILRKTHNFVFTTLHSLGSFPFSSLPRVPAIIVIWFNASVSTDLLNGLCVNSVPGSVPLVWTRHKVYSLYMRLDFLKTLISKLLNSLNVSVSCSLGSTPTPNFNGTIVFRYASRHLNSFAMFLFNRI